MTTKENSTTGTLYTNAWNIKSNVTGQKTCAQWRFRSAMASIFSIRACLHTFDDILNSATQARRTSKDFQYRIWSKSGQCFSSYETWHARPFCSSRELHNLREKRNGHKYVLHLSLQSMSKHILIVCILTITLYNLINYNSPSSVNKLYL
jgi:hypothetical protein